MTFMTNEEISALIFDVEGVYYSTGHEWVVVYADEPEHL